MNYKILLYFFFMCVSCLPTLAQEEDTNKVITKTTQVKMIKFDYNTKDLIPEPFPKISINEEALLQNKLSIEDLKKIASIKYDQGWHDLSKKLINYQKSLVTPKKLISMEIAHENQERCHKLLFNIISNHIERWWD